jgi:phasin protein
MAQLVQEPQDTFKDSPRKSAQAALHKTPEAAVRKARSEVPKKSETTKAGARGDGTDEGMVNAQALEAMVKANAAMMQGMAEMQRQIMEFSGSRLRLDVETQEALAHCSDLREAFQVQADFTQKAMCDYAEQVAKLLNLSAKVSCDCRDPIEHATRAAFGAMTPR